LLKMPDPRLKTQLAFSLLQCFPPLLRGSVLQDSEFRGMMGLQMQANIRLNQWGVTFDRASLYSAVRVALAKDSEPRSITAGDKTEWLMSKDESGFLMVIAGDRTVPLPDFECLSPDRAVRLDWFERQAKSFGIDDAAADKWRAVLGTRTCDDEEVEELRTEFRLTPRWFADTLLQNTNSAAEEADLPIANLVPDEPRYYFRLVGSPVEKDLLSYVKSDLSRHIERLIEERGIDGVALALLLSVHSGIPQEIRLNNFSNNEIIKLFEWLEGHGDRISQLGGIELGLAHLDGLPELEPVITKMIQGFVDGESGEQGRLAELAGLIVLVDGELARTGILRRHQPYWRRLAAIAHASLLERELLRRGACLSDFSTWAFSNRGQLYFLQNNIDLRLEPRWLPDFLSPNQLKEEFVGRIAAAVVANEAKINSPELRSLAVQKGSPLQSLIVFPGPFLPGPMEGGVEAVLPMPPEIERQVYEDLKAEAVNPLSFTGLVNSALIFKLGVQMADLAAEALRRAKYQLRDVGTNTPALALLHGLAVVAAVTRSEGLAAEIRVLVRVARRRPDSTIGLSDTLRIVLVAAGAYSDIDKWCTFLGEWLTELSYEDMDRSNAKALWSHLRGLYQIERRLWGTCARADAACESVSGG
jgi:hypothetical protein